MLPMAVSFKFLLLEALLRTGLMPVYFSMSFRRIPLELRRGFYRMQFGDAMEASKAMIPSRTTLTAFSLRTESHLP
jgi:hypothetical protein